MSFWYLATPYSKYKGGIVAAFNEAARQAAVLLRAGVPVFCPITHSHPIAIYGEIDPLDHSIWLESDGYFMEAARGLIVCELDGWKESYGVNHEIKCFEKQGKPIVQMTPGVVPDFFNLKSPAANILKIADSLVHGDRGVSYGHPEDDFSCVAAIATAMLRRQGKLAGNEVISAEDWALFMVACKITRECYQHKIDNLVDGAGYFETLQMIHERRAGRS